MATVQAIGAGVGVHVDVVARTGSEIPLAHSGARKLRRHRRLSDEDRQRYYDLLRDDLEERQRDRQLNTLQKMEEEPRFQETTTSLRAAPVSAPIRRPKLNVRISLRL